MELQELVGLMVLQVLQELAVHQVARESMEDRHHYSITKRRRHHKTVHLQQVIYTGIM